MINITTMTEEQFDEWFEGSCQQIAAELRAYDFDQIKETTGVDFIEWFIDRVQDGHYLDSGELVNLIQRTHFWQVTDALDVATDFIQHIVDNTSAY